MWRGILLVCGLLLAGLALLVMAALRDDPARPASGERRVATREGVPIHYFTAGPAEGSPVAFVPSYARSASDFNELAAALNDAGFRTLAMQPRGIDGSGGVGETTLHTYAQDLRAVADAERAERIVVCGHAWGNRVARAFATGFPERTRALVLLAAGGSAPTPPEMIEAIGRAVFDVHPESVRRESIDRAFFAEGNPVPEHWMRGWYPRGGLAQMSANQSTPYAEWGDGGDAPILVLQPEQDAVAPTGGPELAKRHPERVRLVTIANAGHALLPEQPEAVAHAVVAYLERLR